MGPESAPSRRAARPWWLVPIVLILLIGVVLALLDSAPVRSLTYSVF